jgi:hypothetical protein
MFSGCPKWNGCLVENEAVVFKLSVTLIVQKGGYLKTGQALDKD